MQHADLAAGCMVVLSPFSGAGVSLQPSGKRAPRWTGKGKRVMGSRGRGGVGEGALESLGTPELGREGGTREDWAGESLRLPPLRGSLGGQVTRSPRAEMPAQEGCIGRKGQL